MSQVGRRVLVAGVGNVFLGDDGFGVEVVRRLGDTRLPPGVDVMDVGTGGVHLAYELLDGRWGALVLVDAIARQEAPGTLFVLEPDLGPPRDECDVGDSVSGGRAVAVPDGHGMDPATVLGLLETLGATPARVLVVGCEPAELVAQMALSPPVAAVVDDAVALVTTVARDEVRALGSTPQPTEVR